MGIEVKNFLNPQIAAHQLADDLSQSLISFKKNKQKTLLLVSGGSAFNVLDFIADDALGDYLTIGALDERYDMSNLNNNFVQLTKTKFYRRAKKAKCDFVDTSVKKNQTQKQLAIHFEKLLHDWKINNKGGIILATIGMGSDGHISGIMPYPENDRLFQKLFCGKNFIVSYDADDKNPYSLRVTTTITFLKLIDSAYGFICGKDKAASFKKITSPGKISELPCRMLKRFKGLIIYTDIR